MAVIVRTSKPRALLNTMRNACRSSAVEGWSCDEDGDFTRSSEDMMAWMRPRVASDRITFSMIGPKGKKVSTTAYAVYHARLIELLLYEYDKYFDSARATAMPTSGDSM